jgi:hypothetical protein
MQHAQHTRAHVGRTTAEATQRPPTTGRPNRRPFERDVELSSAHPPVHGDRSNEDNFMKSSTIIDCRPPENPTRVFECASRAGHRGEDGQATPRHDSVIESFRTGQAGKPLSNRLVFGTISLSRDAGPRQSRHGMASSVHFATRIRHVSRLSRLPPPALHASACPRSSCWSRSNAAPESRC